MVRRLVFGAFVASLVAVGIAAQGCYIGASGGSNCDPQIPIKCCQCPLPEDCPPFAKEWPKMPPECDPYLYDGGVDGGETSDAGMSFCSGGKCVPPAPEAWTNVAFVMAWPELPPACPEDAPMLAFEGNPTPPDRACPACSCDAPEGSCIVPTTWTAAVGGVH